MAGRTRADGGVRSRGRALRVLQAPAAIALALALTGPLAAPAPARAQAAAALRLKTNALSVDGADRTYAYYVSTKSPRNAYQFVVFALRDNGQTAEQFAEQSGWAKLAEDNGFAVVFPEPLRTWLPNSGGEDAYLDAVYRDASTHMLLSSTPIPAGRPESEVVPRITGGKPRVITWQPFEYLTGVGEGARIAQEYLINHPGVFAAAATLGGAPYDAAYARGDEVVQGYLQNQRGGKNAVPVWRPLKKDVPAAIWIFTRGPASAAEAKDVAYWRRANGTPRAPESKVFDGLQTTVYASAANETQQVRLTALPANAKYDRSLTSAIWSGFFARTARWTSEPNGRLGPMMTEAEVDRTFTVKTFDVGGVAYRYYVKTPSTYRAGQSLPVVLAAHGAIYPAWMYLNQLRMHEVGEKEGFITVYLNAEGNVWDIDNPDRGDAKYIEQVIDRVVADYGADRSRVYLQGFSFGSGETLMMGLTHPQLFAAISPNSGIGDFPKPVTDWIARVKAKSDIRIPTLVVYGAVDVASSTDAKIPAEGPLRNAIDLVKRFNNIKTPDRVQRFASPNTAPYDVLVPGAKLVMTGIEPHFPGGRIQRYDYVSADPKPLNLFSWAWVTDMPHGQAERQAQFEWDYFKHWKRNPDGTLTYTP
ncbi:MAG TPA: PHB depolymerase family esterase [Caulobacteraceae bacterium]|jgi:poly(3-hydroxybutyrate) depolymerase|nr:PHB depolymerase family esterase [Caulobacteraceae bacterium]